MINAKNKRSETVNIRTITISGLRKIVGILSLIWSRFHLSENEGMRLGSGESANGFSGIDAQNYLFVVRCSKVYEYYLPDRYVTI